MDKSILIARLRQLLAIDKNARDIYTDLANSVDDGDFRKQLADIAKDEGRHCVLEEEAIFLLEK